MGQCVSKKAAKALAATTVITQHRSNMQKHQKLHESPEEEVKSAPSRKTSASPITTKGLTSSFGFKRRPVPTGNTTRTLNSGNPTAAKRLANADGSTDRNGNNDNDDREPLTTNIVPSGRTTPRLPAPKKESNATTKVSRFGFRQPQANRYNKVADINNTQPAAVSYLENVNNNRESRDKKSPLEDANKIIGKYQLQSNQLPRPVAVRIVETKTAKTLENINRKVSGMNPNPNYHQSSDESSKDGSSYLTEDSGIGGTCRRIEQLNSSPMNRSRPNRNLELVVSGNKFDVRDFEDASSVVLPRLPSAFSGNNNLGFVRERTQEYQRNIDRDKRKVSVTSSEASSDLGEEQKCTLASTREKQRFLKSGNCGNLGSTPKTFLKRKVVASESSPPTSDDQMWSNAGEAMADEFSCSFSSSDESKDGTAEVGRRMSSGSSIGTALQNLMTASKTHSLHKCDLKQVLLTIEDPKFAAVAAASTTALLTEETSPEGSLLHTLTETDEAKPGDHNKSKSSSSPTNSTDKTQIFSSPGTPTNASNSLSLSEGRDFLIDDEIADQPGLLCGADDTITNNSETITSGSEMPTLVDATPLPVRRRITLDSNSGGVIGHQNQSWTESPVVARRRSNRLRSRAGSLDTLSPCESIASDDFMMDFEQSMSSGIDDVNERSDRHSTIFSFDDGNVTLRSLDISKNEVIRDWSCLLSTGSAKSLTTRPSRLLRSRGGTPTSSIGADSPRSSLDGLLLRNTTAAAVARSTTNHSSAVSPSPLRLSSSGRSSSTAGGGGGYESDESAAAMARSAMIQDAKAMKTMLFRLKRVLQEQMDEDLLSRSETHNPFDTTPGKNGIFSSNGHPHHRSEIVTSPTAAEESRLELAELRRQVVFLQGQLEDREKDVVRLQAELEVTPAATPTATGHSTMMDKTECGRSRVEMCNAATQTERVRPISCGPSLLDGSSSNGSLVSVNETPPPCHRIKSSSSAPTRKLPPTSPNYINSLMKTSSASKPLRPVRQTTITPTNSPSPTITSSSSSIPRRSCSRPRAITTPT